jgi:hypothetical protein
VALLSTESRPLRGLAMSESCEASAYRGPLITTASACIVIGRRRSNTASFAELSLMRRMAIVGST